MQLILGVFAVGGHALTRCSQDCTGSANVVLLESTFIKRNSDKGRKYELCLSVWYKTFILNLLTPWSRVLLEKLTGSAASQEIPRI
jgi:hypothetical protein